MKPYYENENGKLYHGDCMEIMPKLDIKVDLVLTDPPYGINADKMTMGSGNHKWDKSVESWDEFIPDIDLFNMLFKISENQIIWGGNYFTEFLKPSKHWIIWDKANPNLSFAEAELAWVHTGKLTRIFKSYSAGMKKIHPTQKPIGLFVYCINNYSKKSDIVLDPFLGSGTTAMACEEMGRKWIGIEREEKYCKIAVERIEAENRQLKLF